MKKLNILLLFLVVFINCKEEKKAGGTEVVQKSSLSYPVLQEGSIEADSEQLWSIISKDAKIEILADGHDWTEGPLWVEDQSMLLYTDIPRNAVYSWLEAEKPKVYLKPSGFLGQDFTGKEPGANGLLLNPDGDLVLCQHGERRVAQMKSPLDDANPEFISLADHFEGRRFNSPNDAVYKSNGDLYFTDPPYGLPKQMDDPEKELDFQGVYRLNAEGEVVLLTNEFSRPNGIAFSPGENKLYVANSDPEQAIWKVFDVNKDGSIENGKIFYDATKLVAEEKGLPDGLKVDNSGNLFATGPGGVFIFSPSGQVMGKIRTGQATSNCAFNSDKSELFITADSYVLRVKLKE